MCLARKGLWSQKANSSWGQYLQFLWDAWPSIAQELACPFHQRDIAFFGDVLLQSEMKSSSRVQTPFPSLRPPTQCCWWSWVLCWLQPFLVGCKPLSRHLAQPDHKWALWNCACHLRLLQLPDFAKKRPRKFNLDATVLSLYVDCFDKSVYIFLTSWWLCSVFLYYFLPLYIFSYFIFKYSGQEYLQV